MPDRSIVRPVAPSPTLRQILRQGHRRLILSAVTMAGVTLVLSGFWVNRGYAARNLTLIAHAVGYTVEPAIIFGDAEAIREGMVSVAGNDAVRSVEVVDRQGRLLARWDRPTDTVMARIERAGGRLLWPTPMTDRVRRGGRVIAVVRVYGSAGGVGGYLLSGVLVALSCLGLTVVATQILARRLQAGVLAPLDRIAAAAHAVRTERAFHQRVPASGIAEVDRLVRDFNALLTELQGWHVGLTQENAELTRQALHDPLTGLGNRALFERVLEATRDEAEAWGTRFALLYLDGNGFKQINDRHGHEAGDAILKVIATRLRQCIRQGDVAFRPGGDEFCVILGPFVSHEDTAAVAARIREAMEPPMLLPDGDTIAMSLSIGFALYPDDGGDTDELVRHADAEMYRDKDRRRTHAMRLA